MSLGAGRPSLAAAAGAAAAADPDKAKRERRAASLPSGDRGVASRRGGCSRGGGGGGATGVTADDGASAANGAGGGVRTHFHTFPCLEDFFTVQRSHRILEESGFYWGHLSSAEAAAALLGKPVGTFLVRDSRHRGHFFSLSAVTARGPTSIRVEFHDGAFMLDTAREAAHAAPRFPCLMKLIEHYMCETRRPQRAKGERRHRRHRHGDDDGEDGGDEEGGGGARDRRAGDGAPPEPRYCVTHDDGSRLPLVLSRPLRRAASPPSMQHACRRAIHRAVPGERLAELPLPAPLTDFLQNYPSQV